MEYNDIINDEKLSVVKAQRGIENIEELYRQMQDDERQEEGEREGNNNNGEDNGE